MKNKNAQSITDAFSQIIKTWNRKPNLLEADDGKEYVSKNFNEFLKQKTFERYSRVTSLEAVLLSNLIEQLEVFTKSYLKKESLTGYPIYHLLIINIIKQFTVVLKRLQLKLVKK